MPEILSLEQLSYLFLTSIITLLNQAGDLRYSWYALISLKNLGVSMLLWARTLWDKMNLLKPDMTCEFWRLESNKWA